MENLSLSKLAKLESVISKGKWRYIFLHGILGWGFTTAVLVFLIRTYTSNTAIIEQVSIGLLIYPVSGIAFGLVMWMRLNNQYNALLTANSQS